MSLTKSQLLALKYHDRFDYPLTRLDLVRWETGELVVDYRPISIQCRNGFYFIKGRQGIIKKRLLREKVSERKLAIAKRAVGIIGKVPTVKMVAITGSLAMKNTTPGADIDLMIITQKGTLWVTRLTVLIVLIILGVPIRRFGERWQKDKLCLNIWLDESDLEWQIKNIFTAHEIAQIVPLVNKNRTYEAFINGNRWIKDYWPKAVSFERRAKSEESKRKPLNILSVLAERFTFFLQHQKMKSKITNEIITPTRAVFHPRQLGT